MPPWREDASNLPCTAMASAVTFCAVPSSQLPTTSTMSNLPPLRPSPRGSRRWRSRSTELPGTPRTSRILPPVLPCRAGRATNLAASAGPSAFWSSLTCITLSVSRTLSNGTMTTLFLSARRITRSKPSGATAMVMIASKPWLMKSSMAPSWAATSVPVETTLNSLILSLIAGLLGEGLGGLDHLDAPGVADEAVDERDPVGAVLLVPLEVLGVADPRLEAAPDRRRAPGRSLGRRTPQRRT